MALPFALASTLTAIMAERRAPKEPELRGPEARESEVNFMLVKLVRGHTSILSHRSCNALLKALGGDDRELKDALQEMGASAEKRAEILELMGEMVYVNSKIQTFLKALDEIAKMDLSQFVREEVMTYPEGPVRDEWMRTFARHFDRGTSGASTEPAAKRSRQ